MTVVAINVTNDRINGNIPLVQSQSLACSNVPGIEIILEEANTIMSIIILAMRPAISPQSVERPISWSCIFLGPNDICERGFRR
jgi:hypothetical protein